MDSVFYALTNVNVITCLCLFALIVLQIKFTLVYDWNVIESPVAQGKTSN